MTLIPTDIDFLAFLGEQESQELHWGTHWKGRLVDRLKNGVELTGACLPWTKTHGSVRLRPAELSIWAGINGHRKSMILGQVMLWVAREQRVCIASLEMQPESTLERMAHQAAGCHAGWSFGEKFADWTDNRVCIYDQLDTVTADRILGMVHYAAKELKCDHIVVDSLTKCGLPTDDYTAQKTFVDRLAWAAKANDVHVHLVCHMRKGQDENHKPGKFDVRGASEITDLADNVFVTWKDKRREEATMKQVMGIPLTDIDQSALERCDQLLTVAKQRHGEFEGTFKLWFHRHSLQFVSSDFERPMAFDI